MSSETIRIGIVGAGGNTQAKHIPLFQAIDGVEVVSLVNRSKASSEAAAQACGVPGTHDSWQDLVADPNIDAVMIGTWPYMHHDVTIAALNAGKHVMTEARMACNATEAEAMYRASQAHPALITQIVPAPFTFAVDKTVVRLINEGFIGDVLAADIRFSGQQFLDPDSPLSWRQDKKMSGNNIMAMGICYESMMRWLGCAKNVIARGKIFVEERDAGDGSKQRIEIPEHLDVIADLHSGAQAHLRMSAIAGFAAENEFRIMGSNGTLIIRGETLLGGQKGDDGLKEIPIPDNERGAWRVEEEFINAIRGNGDIQRTPFIDGVRYMRFTDAVCESLSSAALVEIEHFEG